MIERSVHQKAVERRLRENPIVGLLGARQVGKTTLARQVLAKRKRVHWFDLEVPSDRAQLEDAQLALQDLRGLVVLDEIQHRPDIFLLLRNLVDRKPLPARFLVLGSASPSLLRQSSESLAGRITYYNLPGFGLGEVGTPDLDRLWLRGGFPRSFLARSHRASEDWRSDFVKTFVERDLALLGVEIPAGVALRFWTMLAHYHAQTWNGSELARALGVTHKTTRRYLDALSAALVVTQLKPWFANVKKRQVKAPKVYVTDSGLLHHLLGVRTRSELQGHPKVGASWEGFLLKETLQVLGARETESYFWATHTGSELDLYWQRGSRRWGFEFKRTSAPRMTKSMHVAMDALDLQQLFVVHAGDATFPLAKRVTALAASRLLDDL